MISTVRNTRIGHNSRLVVTRLGREPLLAVWPAGQTSLRPSILDTSRADDLFIPPIFRSAQYVRNTRIELVPIAWEMKGAGSTFHGSTTTSNKHVVRVARIGLAFIAWEAIVLPLNHTRSEPT